MVALSARTAPPAASWVHTWLWLLIGLVWLVAFYFLFSESIVRVVKVYKRPEFSHGWIIPLISAWLLWQRRRLIWEQRDRGAASGWWLVAGGMAVVIFSAAANIDKLPYLAILPVLIGLAATAFGWLSARLFVVPVVFLAFGFPLPNSTYIELSTTLQLLSSEIGATILKALGIPVFLEGNIIDLGIFKLQVAEACSGLRYLLPLLCFGVICAYMYRAPLWAKAFVVVSTIPLTILLNGARIALTGVLVAYGSEELAQGFMHLFEGWVIFLIALGILFGVMWLLARLGGEARSFSTLLDFDRMAGEPNGRRPTRPASPVLIMEITPAVVPRPVLWSTITVLLAAVALLPLSMRSHDVPERPGLLSYPLQLDSWEGRLRWLDPTTEAELDVDDYLLADFVEGTTGDVVNLWIAYYDNVLRDGAMVHLPTTCLPGAGWEFVEFGVARTTLKDFANQPLQVNRAVVTLGTQRILMYFWLELRGRHAIGQEARLLNIWDSTVHGRSDGALVRLFTNIGPGEMVEDGEARLLRFLELAYPQIEPHVGA